MRIVLGVSGGIAAYKAAEIARALIQNGHEVQAVLTRGARKFIRPLTFASLTGRKVITGLFSSASPEATLSSSIEHIGIAQEHDLLLVAPATANVIGKFAHGIADDFLATLYLAFRGPVILAPAIKSTWPRGRLPRRRPGRQHLGDLVRSVRRRLPVLPPSAPGAPPGQKSW